MAKNDTGLTQLKNGNWQYRIKVKLPNGTVLDTTCRQDEDGEPFRTKTAARNARMAKLVAIKNDKSLQAKKSCTFNEVWAYYKKNDALGQAPTTQTKHDSVWRNHFVTEFGHRDINSVTISEIDNFLIRKYNTPNSKGEYLSYAGSTDETKQIMREGLQKLNTAEPMVEIPTINGGTRMVKQSEQAKLNAMLAVIPH